MTTFAFTPQRVAEIRQHPGQLCATLVPVSESVLEGRTRRFSRLVKRTVEENGEERTKLEKELVQDVGYAGQLRPARLTVLLVELVDIYAERASPPLRVLDFPAARAAGFKTPGEMRDDYKIRHPRSEFGKLVWFCLGDVRDRDRFLQRWISRGGDYTHDRRDAIDELPALSEAQLEELAHGGQQKTDRRRADQSEQQGELTLAQRAARLEAVGDALRREVREELRIITDRTARGIKKLLP